MRLSHLLRPAAAGLAAAVLVSCDLLPVRARLPAEQAAADSGAVFGDTAGSYQPSASRRARPPRRSTAATRSAAGASSADTGADTAIQTPPPPTPDERARATMSLDLRRLADAQSEHLANEGRYSPRLARLGLRYIPHAGVRVQLVSGDAEGWAAVATHERFPDEQCAIWVGQAPDGVARIAPAEGIPGCAAP